MFGKKKCLTPRSVLEGCQAELTYYSAELGRYAVVGAYMKGDKRNRYGYYYDKLFDEDARSYIHLLVSADDRQEFDTGDTIRVEGSFNFNVYNGSILVYLRVEKGAMSMVRKSGRLGQILQQKQREGRKDVDYHLMRLIRRGRKPHLALVLPPTSIARSDMGDDIDYILHAYQCDEHRVRFTDPEALCLLLEALDREEYDAIALVSGGGDHLASLNVVPVAECLAGLVTPWIYGCGHEEDRYYIRQIADLDMAVPARLAKHLREIAWRAQRQRQHQRQVLAAIAVAAAVVIFLWFFSAYSG